MLSLLLLAHLLGWCVGRVQFQEFSSELCRTSAVEYFHREDHIHREFLRKMGSGRVDNVIFTMHVRGKCAQGGSNMDPPAAQTL